MDERLPEYAEAVIDVVDEIPPGRLLGYGDVAELVGSGGPRQVGQVMARYGGLTCWWRVTRSSGLPAQVVADEALAHWREEGTPLVGGPLGTRADMRQARWEGPVRPS